MLRVKLTQLIAFSCGLTLFSASASVAQQPTAITGRITEATSGQPIPGAQVMIVGTNLGAQSNSNGTYIVRGLAPGNVTVRVLTIGYTEKSQQVNVAAGQTATLNFQLETMAIALAPVVATVTGEQRRVEVGNAVAHVNAAEVVASRAVTNMADLLTCARGRDGDSGTRRRGHAHPHPWHELALAHE
jgi:hypothetical protein